MTDNYTIHIKLPSALVQALNAWADEEHRSTTNLIRKVLIEALEERSKPVEEKVNADNHEIL